MPPRRPIRFSASAAAGRSSPPLVECTANALRGEGDLDQALVRYRKRHRRELAGHEFLISDYATGRAFNPIEKLMYSAAAKDPAAAAALLAFGACTVGVGTFLSPRAVARAVWVNIAHRSPQLERGRGPHLQQ